MNFHKIQVVFGRALLCFPILVIILSHLGLYYFALYIARYFLSNGIFLQLHYRVHFVIHILLLLIIFIRLCRSHCSTLGSVWNSLFYSFCILSVSWFLSGIIQYRTCIPLDRNLENDVAVKECQKLLPPKTNPKYTLEIYLPKTGLYDGWARNEIIPILSEQYSSFCELRVFQPGTQNEGLRWAVYCLDPRISDNTIPYLIALEGSFVFAGKDRIMEALENPDVLYNYLTDTRKDASSL